MNKSSAGGVGKSQVAALCLTILVGAALRLWRLADLAWEQDELYTLRDATDLGATASAAGAPGILARPLYYLLQHVLLQVSPATPAALRLPAYVFGVLGIPLTWWAGRQLFGNRAGITAAILVAVSPWHLYASQFARYWSLVYLLSVVTVGLLARAIREHQPSWYLYTVLAALLGAATHPTFLIALAGVALGTCLVDAKGSVRLHPPAATAVRYLWMPLLLAAALGVLAVLAIRPEALSNDQSRGVAASLRLIPAMIQWTSPTIAGAAVAACILLWGTGSANGRRWATVTAAVVVSLFGGLLVLSFWTGVYADYGISCLPLLVLVIGGAIDHVERQLPAAHSWFAAAATTGLVIGSAPETLSHLVDGSRFDYRPALHLVRSLGPDHPVVGSIGAVDWAEYPSLRYVSLGRLRRLDAQQSFWFVTSVKRFGLREGSARLQQWIDAHCRRVASFERKRLDYRQYRVELHWCGPNPVPTRSVIQ